MNNHISFRQYPVILNNFSKSIGRDFTITVPCSSYGYVNIELIKYNARLGFNYDLPSSESFGFKFKKERDKTFFLLKFS